MNKVIEQDVRKLKFNESFELEENVSIRRTIGGWIVEYLNDYPVEDLEEQDKCYYHRKVISCCFVPDDEGKMINQIEQTPEQKETTEDFYNEIMEFKF